jgi:FtsH-binding integral membrane protein
MAMHTESLTPGPVARQLRRMRAMYAAGVALWAASTAWTGWASPASRPMWTSLLLLVVFTGLLALASWWLRRMESVDEGGRAAESVPRRSAAVHHARV